MVDGRKWTAGSGWQEVDSRKWMVGSGWQEVAIAALDTAASIPDSLHPFIKICFAGLAPDKCSKVKSSSSPS